MTNAKFTAPRTEKEAALQILIEALFEFGDVLFEPDGPNGPSLVVNNEPGTEISLTESQSDILKAAGVPAFKEGGDAPLFDDLMGDAEGDARALMEKIRDAGEEGAFIDALLQLAPRMGDAARK